MRSILVILLSCLQLASCQNVSTYVNPAVPTGTPIAGNYSGPLRPQVHFSPPKNFMNDPNGMFVDANGTWHLYYQYNPTAPVAGNQHWGHATSRDLYHWQNQPIALFPPEQMIYVFSGSAVIDDNNTSGFFPNQTNGVVAMFTLARYFTNGAGPQTQNIAYSRDGGYSFQLYDGNPVINSTSSQFRDPKVIRYQGTWVAVVSYAQDFAIGIFTSPDLKTWTATSNFTYHGLLGVQYECPNLVKMPMRAANGSVTGSAYVMAISVQPGAPLGGSITEYFPGDFNGTHFVPFDAATRLTDFAKDNYAGQYFYGVPEGQDAVQMAWASNWQYAQVVPTAREGWRSAMSAPRAQFLQNATRIGLTLVNRLYDVTPILDEPVVQTSIGNGTVASDFSSVASNAMYVEANVTGLNASAVLGTTTLNLTFSSATSNESLASGFYFGGDTPFFIDRGGVDGFDNVFFTDKFSVADVYSDGVAANVSWRMAALFDRSICEWFVDGGIHAATVLFYPTQPLTQLTLAAADMPAGAVISVAVWSVKSAWATYEDGMGNVVGNVSGSANSSSSSPGMRRRHLYYEGKFTV